MKKTKQYEMKGLATQKDLDAQNVQHRRMMSMLQRMNRQLATLAKTNATQTHKIRALENRITRIERAR